jgi:hypothetical protein
MTPNPYRKKEVDLGSYTASRQRAAGYGVNGMSKCKYGGYLPGTQLQSGNTFYERIYLGDFNNRDLKGWQEYMRNSKTEWETVNKVQRLIAGK